MATYLGFIQPLVPRFDDLRALSWILGIESYDIVAVDASVEVVARANAFGEVVRMVMVMVVRLVVAISVVVMMGHAALAVR